jgi:serine protease AprX
MAMLRLRATVFTFIMCCLPTLLEAAGSQAIVPLNWLDKLHGSPLDANDNQVADDLEALPGTQTVEVILDLTGCLGAADKARLSVFGTVDDESIEFPVAHMSNVLVSKLVNLAKDPSIAFVEGNHDVYHTLTVSNPAIQVKKSADYAPPPLRTVHDKFPGLTGGGGPGIIIVDSGIDNQGGPGTTHEALPHPNGSLICNGTLFNPNCQAGDPDDQTGTGTAMAAIALGSGEGTTEAPHQGIAPDASPFDVQAKATGLFAAWRLLRVLGAVANNNDFWHANILLLPWTTCLASNGTDALSVAVNNLATTRNLIPVVSMGNCSTCLHKSPFCNTCPCPLVPSPAAAAQAIAVGSSDDHNSINRSDDTPDPDSLTQPNAAKNADKKPDLLAPGVNIETAVFDTINGYANVSGSSAAAAHVAGCLALMTQLYNMSPGAAKDFLQGAVEDRGPAGWDPDYGNGLLNCFDAVDHVNSTQCADLQFDGGPCGGFGQFPCWAHPGLQAVNWPIEGIPNTVRATIRNNGPGFSVDSKIKIRVDMFSNGDNAYEICSIDLPPMAPGTTMNVDCPWTPNISGGAPGIVHACLFGSIVSDGDCLTSNNGAQHNEDIQQSYSPAVFPVGIENPGKEPVTIELQGTFDCQGNPCPGWIFGVNNNFFSMAPEDCPVTVMLSASPSASTAVREAKVQVQTLGHTAGGQALDLGGMTIRARLACATSNLVFTDSIAFNWRAPSGFSVCPTTLDVARGTLPITKYNSKTLRGDFSSATCLANELSLPQYGDPTNPPVGTGFYYVARAGGYDPGSWDIGDLSQKGHADDTLNVCPYP